MFQLLIQSNKCTRTCLHMINSTYEIYTCYCYMYTYHCYSVNFCQNSSLFYQLLYRTLHVPIDNTNESTHPSDIPVLHFVNSLPSV